MHIFIVAANAFLPLRPPQRTKQFFQHGGSQGTRDAHSGAHHAHQCETQAVPHCVPLSGSQHRTLVEHCVRWRRWVRAPPSNFRTGSLALSRLRQVPWAAKLEENTALIREEYDALVASKAPSDYHLHTDEHKVQTAARGSCFCSCTHFALRPAHSCTPDRGTGTRTSRLGSGSRSLSGAGAARSRFRHLPPRHRCVSPHRHCPTTASLLNNIPGLMTDIPFAYSFFSTLAPGSAIAPHHGATNLKVRCHLTLHCAFPQRRMPRRCNPAHCTALPHCLLSSPTRLPAVCLARGR